MSPPEPWFLRYWLTAGGYVVATNERFVAVEAGYSQSGLECEIWEGEASIWEGEAPAEP